MAITAYTFGLSIGYDVSSEGATMTFTNASGMTDELALELVRALAALPWPAQSNPHCSVTRLVTEQSQTQSNPENDAFIEV